MMSELKLDVHLYHNVNSHLISHLNDIQCDRTPLHLVCNNDYHHSAAVQLLLQAGADKDAKDKVISYLMVINCYQQFRYLTYISSLSYTV